MTRLELIKGTLTVLDRRTDSQSVDLWREKIGLLLNEGLNDIGQRCNLVTTEAVTITEGSLELETLEQSLIKVRALFLSGIRTPFFYGVGGRRLRLTTPYSGNAQICYRYMPKPLEADTDVPALPRAWHGMLITYAAARERLTGDGAAQSAGRLAMELYRGSLKRLGAYDDDPEGYRLKNCY